MMAAIMTMPERESTIEEPCSDTGETAPHEPVHQTHHQLFAEEVRRLSSVS